MRNKKGITLIALIVTVIIMIILVSVTINITLNKGILDKTREAVIKTEENLIFEEIISCSDFNNKGDIEVLNTFNNFIESYGEDKVKPNEIAEGETEITFEVTGNKGIYPYTITKEKIIKGKNEMWFGCETERMNVYACLGGDSLDMYFWEGTEGIHYYGEMKKILLKDIDPEEEYYPDEEEAIRELREINECYVEPQVQSISYFGDYMYCYEPWNAWFRLWKR